MRTLLLGAILTVAALPLTAATRLTYAMGDKVTQVSWPKSAMPIGYAVDSKVAAALPPGTIDRAFAVWSSIPDSDVEFKSLGTLDNLQFGQDGRNSFTFVDELLAGQKAIAATSNWYDKNGNLTEADIQIDPSYLKTDYNIQHALAHEIGHVLGLDHSAVLSSLMYPYVPRGSETPNLDSDDRIGIAMIYPKADPTMVGGILRGRVIGDSGGIFAAQVVAVSDRGQPVATGLSNSVGEFELRGLPAGSYRVYAEPLDGPVDCRNLTGVWRGANMISFPTRFSSGGVLQVESGKVIGNLIVDTAGPVQLNPKWVGVTPPGQESFNLTTFAPNVKQGQSINLAVAGDGFVSGMTTFEVLNPGFRRTSDFRYAGNYVYATFAVENDAPGGSAVILVTQGTQTATLTGALRIPIAAAHGRIARK